MHKDYYVLLGVSRDADIQTIKKAYRDIVKKYHPDTAQSGEDTEKFLEIKKAYETLSDPEKRRHYDKKRAHDRAMAYRRSTQPFKAPVEDLVEWYAQGTAAVEDVAAPVFSSNEQDSKRDTHLAVEIILSPREAAEGGRFPLIVPIQKPCPRCRGAGILGACVCVSCKGRGSLQYERTVMVNIPPHIRSGAEFMFSLEDIGLPKVVVHATVYVDVGLGDPFVGVDIMFP
ncbi:MAG: DnaJ domain-containing protein [Desulfobacterota bacterium]|nr:DnaJ domain-containing protein [Thermodesulfobacteriota bacterium]